MARPNAPRSVGAEDNLAERISRERQLRGWSYETLAERMTAEGCSIQASAIYKIEKGNPRRRITLDEVVVLSKVFGIELDNLLMPVDELDDAMAAELRAALMERYEGLVSASEEYVAILAQIIELHSTNRDVHDYVMGHLPQESDIEEWAHLRPWFNRRTGETTDVGAATLAVGLRGFIDKLTEQAVELVAAKVQGDLSAWSRGSGDDGER